VPIHHAWLFFPKSPGLATGIILAGYGFGAFIFDNVSTHVINPNGESIVDGRYPADVNERFAKMMRVLVVCWMLCVIVGITMVWAGPVPRKKKSNAQSRAQIAAARYQTGATDYYGANTSEANAPLYPSQIRVNHTGETSSDHEEFNTKSTVDRPSNADVIDYTIPMKSAPEATMGQMICSTPFILLYVMNAMSIITGFFAVNNFKTYGQANGLTDDNYLALLGSAAAICNSIRFLWSWATDYLPYKIVYGFMLVI